MGKTEEVKLLNHHISTFRTKVYEARLALIERGKEVRASSIKNLLLGREEKARGILQVFKEHNARMAQLVGKEFSEGTLKRYQTSLQHTASSDLKMFTLISPAIP